MSKQDANKETRSLLHHFGCQSAQEWDGSAPAFKDPLQFGDFYVGTRLLPRDVRADAKRSPKRPIMILGEYRKSGKIFAVDFVNIRDTFNTEYHLSTSSDLYIREDRDLELFGLEHPAIINMQSTKTFLNVHWIAGGHFPPVPHQKGSINPAVFPDILLRRYNAILENPNLELDSEFDIVNPIENVERIGIFCSDHLVGAIKSEIMPPEMMWRQQTDDEVILDFIPEGFTILDIKTIEAWAIEKMNWALQERKYIKWPEFAKWPYWPGYDEIEAQVKEAHKKEMELRSYAIS